MKTIKKSELINEFINQYGDIINSTYRTVNPKSTSKSTTDDHIAASRQGMVWMNYRRYYGESAEELPYNDVADACTKDPKSFYDFLIDNGEEPEVFEQYFTYEENTEHEAEEELGEAEAKMKESILNINKKYNDLVTRTEDLPSLDEIEAQEPLVIGKLKDIVDFINKHFDDNQKRVLLDYMKESINYG